MKYSNYSEVKLLLSLALVHLFLHFLLLLALGHVLRPLVVIQLGLALVVQTLPPESGLFLSFREYCNEFLVGEQLLLPDQ